MNSHSIKAVSGNDQTIESPATYPLDTDQFAANNRVKASSVRHRFCITGSYFGVKPKKLVNGRLAWPNVQVEA